MSVITYDDRDPIIHYSAGWAPGGNAQDVDGTSTFTIANGTTATITFTGVQISVFGTIPFVLPKTTSAYSIDGGSPTLFTASFQADNAGDPNSFFFRQLYYQSPKLTPNTPHTLVISQAVDTPTRFYLDSIQVVSADPVSSASSTSTTQGTTSAQRTTTGAGTSALVSLSSSTSTSTSTAFTTSSSTPTLLRAPTSSSTESTASTSGVASSPLAATTTTTTAPVGKASSPPIGTIVGSVIGVLAVILLGIGVYLLWKQQRQKNRLHSVAEDVTVKPFPTQAPAEYNYSQLETPGSASSVADSFRAPTSNGKGQDLAMGQYGYTGVSNPPYSRHTLLENPPPQYER